MPDSCVDMNSGLKTERKKKKEMCKTSLKYDYITKCPRQYTVIKQLEGSNLLVDYCCTSLLVSLSLLI